MKQEQIFSKVTDILTNYLHLNPEEVSLQSHIINDLGADSLSLVEIGFLFSEAFGIPMLQPSEENMIMQNLVSEIEQQMQDLISE